MKGLTHLAFGICTGVATAVAFGPKSFGSLAIMTAGTAIGSVLPDIDNVKSIVGSKVKLISHTVNKMFGHRGVTHAPLILIGLYFLGNYLVNKYLDISFMPVLYCFLIGYAGHIILDYTTKGGVPLFYPFLKKRYKLTKMKSSGGLFEFSVSGLLLCMYTFSLYLFVPRVHACVTDIASCAIQIADILKSISFS